MLNIHYLDILLKFLTIYGVFVIFFANQILLIKNIDKTPNIIAVRHLKIEEEWKSKILQEINHKKIQSIQKRKK